MRDIHVMDEIKENGATAFFLGAFLLGMVVFALVTGGFAGG